MRTLRKNIAAKVSAMASEPNADLVWGLIVGVVVRVLGQYSLLNTLYAGYGAQGGNPLLKISPGTYIILLVGLRAFRRPNPPGMEDFKLGSVLLMLIVFSGLGLALVGGQAVAVGYLVDSYMVAAVGLYVLGKIGPKGREKVFDAFIWLLVFNAFFLFIEYGLKRRLIPAPLESGRGIFRPAGLLNHPLMSGLMYATAVPLTMGWKRPFLAKLSMSLFFAVCVFASGARVSTVLTAVAFLPAFIIALRREKPKTSLGQSWLVTQSLLFAGMVVVAGIVTVASGFLDRISGGLYDKSSATRVWQYQLLNYLSPHEWMVGIGNSTAADWSMRLFQTQSVESSIVLGIFMYGLPFTVFYLATVMLTAIIYGMRGDLLAKLAVAVFLTAVMSNNTLGAKNPALFYLMMFMGATMTGQVRRMSIPRLPGVVYRPAPRPQGRLPSSPPRPSREGEGSPGASI